MIEKRKEIMQLMISIMKDSKNSSVDIKKLVFNYKHLYIIHCDMLSLHMFLYVFINVYITICIVNILLNKNIDYICITDFYILSTKLF